MSISEPTNCCKCNKDLSEGFRSDRYLDDKIVESYCYKCNGERVFHAYLATRRLSTQFMMENFSFLYERSKILWNQYPYFDALLSKDKYADILMTPIHLNTWIMLSHDSTDTVLKERLKAFASMRKIEERVKEFEQKVWFGGLQKQIRASTMKGVSAKVKLNKREFSVLTYSMCGRTMITFDLGDDSVTAITLEDESDRSRMGIQGIDATAERALNLIDTALSMWELGELVFKNDKKVNMGF